MNDKQIGALIPLLTGLSKEYKGLGIRRRCSVKQKPPFRFLCTLERGGYFPFLRKI